MTERVGGPHKAKRMTVNVDEETHAKLLKYAQSKKLSMSVILSQFVGRGVEYDIYDDLWIKKLLADMKIEKAVASLDGACHKLGFGEDKSGVGNWFCVAFNSGGTVKVRVLGKTDSLKDGKCKACNQDREVREGLVEATNKVRVLENKIQMKARTERKVPICNRGAILCQEGTAFKSCPKSSVPVSVSTYCKVLSGGLPCALYAEIQLTEGPR